MAQSNAAREPSMDEILASIRKIIESNEPGIPGFAANDSERGNNGGFGANNGYDDEPAEEIHLTIDDDVLVAEFDAELGQQPRSFEAPTRDLPPEMPKASIPPQTPPLSLADVAARVRAASERNTYMTREPQTTNALSEQSSDSPMVTSRMAPSASAKTITSTTEPVAKVQAAETAAVVSAPVQDKTETTTAQPTIELAEKPVSNVAMFAEKDVAAIVSPAVGQQVAKSFDNLAFALDSSNRRSFDEIAEDMLRPMLQEWLDDNLPTLVERLVREEIERVARGPRR
jgi:cell pole-organizing protein PopZ